MIWTKTYFLKGWTERSHVRIEFYTTYNNKNDSRKLKNQSAASNDDMLVHALGIRYINICKYNVRKENMQKCTPVFPFCRQFVNIFIILRREHTTLVMYNNIVKRKNNKIWEKFVITLDRERPHRVLY